MIRAVLVVDPDKDFLDSLRADPRTESVPVVVSNNGKDAQALLADSAQPFLGVFVNPETRSPGGGPGGLSVIRAAHLHHPITPIYVIHDGAAPFSPRELKSLGVQRAFEKPVTFEKIVGAVQPVSVFDPRAAVNDSRKNKSVDAEGEISGSDDEFVAIGAADFLAGTRSFFDVFVRLSSGRYLKLLNAGDEFQHERVSYLAKGITHFHIRREAQHHYVSYCNHIASRVLDGNGISIKLKSSQTINHGEQVLSYLRLQGLSEANLSYATGYADNLSKLVKQLKPSSHDILNGFLAAMTAHAHGVAVSMIAGLIARELKIYADESLRIVGLAALLHDIGLFPMPDEVQHEDRRRMSDEERNLFETHPVTGALILSGLHGVHPSVIQAVRQHHERSDQKGFPARIGAGRINKVAEIVGISDELVRLVVEAQKDRAQLPRIGAKLTVALQGFSHPTIEAFRAVFFPAENALRG